MAAQILLCSKLLEVGVTLRTHTLSGVLLFTQAPNTRASCEQQSITLLISMGLIILTKSVQSPEQGIYLPAAVPRNAARIVSCRALTALGA